VLRLSADDLAKMYYTMKIPEARAKKEPKRNCILVSGSMRMS